MKNIQVIDGALNCTFSIFRATDEEFVLLFPEPGQEIQFAEDLDPLVAETLGASPIWERPIRKRDAHGIHGTLFFGLERYKSVYRDRREDGVEPHAVNAAQRRLFGI
ncbi:hypothetical protein [Bradyrhizobium sp. USDA 10063]